MRYYSRNGLLHLGVGDRNHIKTESKLYNPLRDLLSNPGQYSLENARDIIDAVSPFKNPGYRGTILRNSAVLSEKTEFGSDVYLLLHDAAQYKQDVLVDTSISLDGISLAQDTELSFDFLSRHEQRMPSVASSTMLLEPGTTLSIPEQVLSEYHLHLGNYYGDFTTDRFIKRDPINSKLYLEGDLGDHNVECGRGNECINLLVYDTDKTILYLMQFTCLEDQIILSTLEGTEGTPLRFERKNTKHFDVG